MRDIKYLVIHCSATKSTMDIGAKEIRSWHVKPVKEGGQGWSDIGYHFIIRRNGHLENGRPVSQAGAHVSGYNSNSIGICLVGGVDAKNRAEDNYTEAQWKTLKDKIVDLKLQHPKAIVQGHRDFPNVKKDCPCFNVKEWMAKEQL